MASRDLHHCCKVTPAILPAAIVAGNATLTGVVIDTQGFESVEIAFMSGAITDSDFTCSLEESDLVGMGDATAVAAADLIGAAPAFASDATGDNQVKKVGYRGTKRYVRAKAVQAGATTGGFLCAVAILGNPRIQPVP